MNWRTLLIVLASAVVVAVMPAVSGAGTGPATTKTEGETSQGLRAATQINGEGLTVYVSVRYKAKCGRRRPAFRSTFVWEDEDGEEAGFERDADAWADARVSRKRFGRRLAIATGRMSGGPGNPNGDEGKFRITVRITNRSGRETIAVCRTGVQSFEARSAGPVG